MPPIDELQQQRLRKGIELVVVEGLLPYKAANIVKLKHQVLDDWLKLYALYGEAIYSPDASERFELELFKLKYPQGAPSSTFLQSMRQNIKGKGKALLLCAIGTPLFMGFFAGLVDLLIDRNPLDALKFGLTCVSTSLFSFMILFTMIWVMNMGASVAKTKLRDRTYIKERRMVDKQEIVGALQLSHDDGNLQGGLEVVQDAGGLELIDPATPAAGDASPQG